MGHPQLTGTHVPLHLAVACDASEIGGAEHSTANLLSTLSAGIEVTVIGVDERICAWLAGHRSGTDAVLVPAIESKRDLGAMRARRRAVARIRPHIYQASLTTVFSGEYSLLAAMSVRGVATIAVEHLPQFGAATWVRRRLKRHVSRRLSAHVTVSDAAARAIEQELGLTPGSVRTIHNGVPDLELPKPPPRTANTVLGTFARLVPAKGLDVLFRALVDVPGARAVIAGSGPEEDALRALAAGLGVADRIELLGYQERPRSLLPGFDVFVLPSRLEGLPLSIVEAMLARLPVVATRVGGVHEVVADERTGLLVPPDDPTTLAAALNTLVDDRARREQMGTAGRARALAEFSVEGMTRAYEALYAEVIALDAAVEPR